MGFEKCFFFFLFFLLVGLASPSPSYIKYDVLEAHVPTGRALLQQHDECPIDFEKENYTIITSQCKGPHYNESKCCDAFMHFACPHQIEINDVQNGCATNMFSYINLYGKYPPGLFANMCKGDKEGLDCKAVMEQLQKTKSPAVKPTQSSLILMLIITIFLFILLNI